MNTIETPKKDETANDTLKGASMLQGLLKFEKIHSEDYAPFPLTGKVSIPDLKSNASFGYKVQLLTNKEQLSELGYPADGLLPNWKEVFLAKFGEILTKYKSVKLFMEICVRCGACADKCHNFLGTADPLNMPMARAELMRKIYRRYFTLAGKLFNNRIAGADDLTERTLVLWHTYFYQCSECRRCSVFCPYGIDTAEITMAAREILNSVGLVQKYMHEVIFKAKTVGNNLGMIPAAITNSIEFVEDELNEVNERDDIKIPLDQEGADVLFVTPSADFFASPHIESLYGYVKVFHQAGISWTMTFALTSVESLFGVSTIPTSKNCDPPTSPTIWRL